MIRKQTYKLIGLMNMHKSPQKNTRKPNLATFQEDTP